jgi:glucose/arabinose dehydrogenase
MSPSRKILVSFIGLAIAGCLPLAAREAGCAGDQSIVVPEGFCATIFADDLGHARQLVAAADGTIYVNTWSGPYYKNDRSPAGGFLVGLKDTKGSGRADVVVRFGPTAAEGALGGVGIAIHRNWLYAEIDDRIDRYAIRSGIIAPTGKAEVVVSGIPVGGAHPMHPFAIDDNSNLLMAIGSSTDACDGNDPCTELETRAGIWRYDAAKTDQIFAPRDRYAAGMRNAEGLDFDGAGNLFATQHGRGHLHEKWPDLYTLQDGFDLPAEELSLVKAGTAYSWPKCYFDPKKKQYVLAPEYGGDGGKKVGVCAGFERPIAAFPAHWAPNDMKIYKGSTFPPKYHGGAFIAFHGSWNNSGPRGGYNVVFQPLADGKAAGTYEVFADGFAGMYKERDRAKHRPAGLAVGPDGALYISDDKAGRVWRVTYLGVTGKI